MARLLQPHSAVVGLPVESSHHIALKSEADPTDPTSQDSSG
jgi:hypothetical protein